MVSPCYWCQAERKEESSFRWYLCHDCAAKYRRQLSATCIVCQVEYLCKRRSFWHRGYCSPECRAAAERKRKARTPVTHAEHPCSHCGESFSPSRSDARYCSGRCRVAAHRARVREA